MPFAVLFVALLGIVGGIHYISDVAPTRFFHESENQYTEPQVKSMVEKYGHDIVIGGDEGHGEDFIKTMAAVDKYKALKHVYVVGPGMWSWSDEEKNEIRTMARSVGINTSENGWLKEWYKHGWKQVVMQKMYYYDSQNFYSIEIDNLDSAFNTIDELLSFYNDLVEFRAQNELTIRLVMKNLSPEFLEIIVATVKDGKIPQSFFAPVGIFEDGTGNPAEQTRLAKQIGITAITPLNGLRPTEIYGTVKDGIKILH